ncbi:MAG: DUF1223 domain-containing protein [Yoonia sp.]|uniref:DUF1223 domain-containing protein n=1 Tax=Yoonia sp. TaxID=2212373 RepID=UPI00273D0140|nr:DUF1223 domain-containing protein [Yoonia sp.]MDP5086447.1 DUF1223 domain-containing protein [Yoonia sp.]MDP5362278.1 DUF1223 domain-containing protein [Paracoccaceae bacterium]
MRLFITVLSFLGMLHATQVMAQDGPVVVELYTSQGCSSCPPADEMLADLAKRDGVIALALHVDYWDYIGWKDSFGRPENTARQHAYAHAANATTVYTPQMIIGGVDHVIGSRPMQVMDTVQAHSRQGNPFDVTLVRRGGDVTITAPPGPRGDYLVQLVRYIPEETVAIGRGENAGRSLTYANIVTSWDVIGRWDGRSALTLQAPAAGNNPVVVIVQQATHGPIVGAAELR